MYETLGQTDGKRWQDLTNSPSIQGDNSWNWQVHHRSLLRAIHERVFQNLHTGLNPCMAPALAQHLLHPRVCPEVGDKSWPFPGAGETLPMAQMRYLTRQANSLMVKIVSFIPFSSLFLYKITEMNKFSQVLLSHTSPWVQEDGQEEEMSNSFKRHDENHRHPNTEPQSPSSLPQKNWEVPSRSRSPYLLTLGNRQHFACVVSGVASNTNTPLPTYNNQK